MPAGPAPIYIATFNGTNFPGYVQEEEQPLRFRSATQNILNRNGGSMTIHGAELREVTLSFIVLSSLDNVTDLQHLNNVKDQYRTALSIMARSGSTYANLYVGNTTRYVRAIPVDITAPLSAGTSRSLRYKVTFLAEPYYVDTTPVSGSFSGNSTVTLTMPATRETYPEFEIPSGVTGFTATHAASGKVVEFLRGSVTGTVRVYCNTFNVVKADGTDVSSTMENVNFGIKHTAGAGAFAIVVTGYAGSGTVDVDAYPRYEL